jgi:hypothetical protein
MGRRYVQPGLDAAVWCPSGRWGPKRVKVTQCWAVLKAEDVYTSLLRDDASKVSPGRRGTLEWTLRDSSGCTSIAIGFELRANAVWRFGRVFLRCPKCNRLATRVYVPTSNCGAACRRCWGLTYESRQERTYRLGRSRWGVFFSPLMYARCRADDARQARAEAAARRYAERREILRRLRNDDRESGLPAF